jgi:recombinational DNA repair ATPase RecF
MLRAETIRIEEFRGIRDLTLDFKGKNFAICGPNGTGKSGIVDALEFALTGNISRLTGKGMGGMSLKEHAPHVDSRNRADKARVTLTATIPQLNKKVTIVRTVKDADKPKITPSDPEIVHFLEQVAEHPEFVLSRRELIRYVISTRGDRAKEVQVLLQLDEVEQLRTALQKIMNASAKEVAPLERAKEQAIDHLLRALEISQLTPEKVPVAVNARRAALDLPPISALTSTTSFRDGLTTATQLTPTRYIAKAQASGDISKLRSVLTRLRSPEIASACAAVIEQLRALSADPTVSDSVTRERFLQSALDLLDADRCPVCDTAWKPEELRAIINGKLRHFEEVKQKRAEAERQLQPLLGILTELGDLLDIVERYGSQMKTTTAVQCLTEFRSAIDTRHKAIHAFLPIPEAIRALESYTKVPANVVTEIDDIEAAISALPEPTQQDAARDYLTIGQERLEAYRDQALRTKQAQERAAISRRVYDTYARVSMEALSDIYKEVQEDFSSLYRYINRDDESKFTAQLTPSIGKLGFDVDFYGRGKFPPGAYHSEGHQDSMGLCLYLALMRHLLGNTFTFAVLDDVLMSVDAGHRREVCNLLREQFPDTQFILTTHDPIWLGHMQAAALVTPSACAHFRTWDVDHGPTEWDDRDIWEGIDDALKRNDVRSAATLLRSYLEYASAQICHKLRAPVEFRGDARFELGDLLPSAIGRFRTLLKEGKAAAQSWGQKAPFEALAALEEKFAQALERTNAERWQVNPAIHYNEWANFQKADFAPVAAYRELIDLFTCSETTCKGLLYVVPERGARDSIKCPCGTTTINLKRKSQGAAPVI